MKSLNILVVGPNPAWQKALLFNQLCPGSVNRAERLVQFPSGKGANFARASRICGASPVLFQFAGGKNGELLTMGLDAETLKHETVVTRSETRTCVTCIEKISGQVTELIEPAGPLTKAESTKLFAAIEKNIQFFDGVALCGTCPPGTPPEFYPRIARLAKKKKIPLLADTFTHINEVLSEGVEILKINADELKQASGVSEIRDGIAKLAEQYRIRIVAITNGAASSLLWHEGKIQELAPRKIKALNSTGAGDTVSAVFLCNLLRGKSPELAFSLGLAAGTASCLSLVSGHFSRRTAKELSPDELEAG